MPELELDRDLDYWSEQLQGPLHVVDLCPLRPRPSVQEYHGSVHSVSLPSELRQELQAFSLANDASLFTTLASVFFLLVYERTQQEDICIVTPVAGSLDVKHESGSELEREAQVELDPILGFLINPFVLRVDLQGKPTFRELLSRVAKTAAEAYAHSSLPFETLVEKLGLDRESGWPPLGQVFFAYRRAPTPTGEAALLRTERVDLRSGAQHRDLALSIAPRDEELACSLEYDTQLYDEAFVRKLMDDYQLLLGSALRNADLVLTDFFDQL